MYCGTCDQSKKPETASASVKAGLMWLPETLPNMSAGIITPKPYPSAMITHPELFPFVPLSSTLATAPLPRMMSKAVPINSVMYFTVHEKSMSFCFLQKKYSLDN